MEPDFERIVRIRNFYFSGSSSSMQSPILIFNHQLSSASCLQRDVREGKSLTGPAVTASCFIMSITYLYEHCVHENTYRNESLCKKRPTNPSVGYFDYAVWDKPTTSTRLYFPWDKEKKNVGCRSCGVRTGMTGSSLLSKLKSRNNIKSVNQSGHSSAK